MQNPLTEDKNPVQDFLHGVLCISVVLKFCLRENQSFHCQNQGVGYDQIDCQNQGLKAASQECGRIGGVLRIRHGESESKGVDPKCDDQADEYAAQNHFE